MSFKIIGKAFDIPLKANDKLVFLVLCEYADDDTCTCYPSLSTIVRKASISKGALSYSLNVLENLGFIKREHRKRDNGSNTSTIYTVFADTVLDEERYKKRQELIKKPGSNNEQGGLVQDMNNPSSDNEQGKGGQSSDNEQLEPLANSNPKDNPKLTMADFLKIWNKTAEACGLSKIVSLTDSRKEKIRNRKSKLQNFDSIFLQACEKIKQSDFLKGVNDRGWKAEFDWIVHNDNNILKIIEGNYDNRGKAGNVEVGSLEWERLQRANQASNDDVIEAEVE
ncbi:MAG: helix-turn-helix domain-containing protein [Sulfurimonas sp.]